LSIYLVFAALVVFFIVSLGKIEAQLYANQFHSPFFDFTFFWSTKIVEWFSVIVILVILIFKGAKYALNGLFIYVVTALITFSLKRLFFFHELRPTSLIPDLRLLPCDYGLTQLTSHSFPSGHTTAAFTLFCYLSIISHHKTLGILYGLIAVLIGYSRIYLSQHFFEDILAGATIAVFVTFVLSYLFDKINYGKWATRPLITRIK